MKKLSALLLAIILVASLFTAVLTAPAYAEETLSATCGTYYESLYERDMATIGYPDITSIVMTTGTIQNGLSVDFSGTKYIIKGTPMEADNRYFEFTVNFSDGNSLLQCFRIITSRGSRDASKQVTCKVGEAFSVNIYDGIGTLSGFSASWNGVKLETSGSALVLSGTPVETGTYTFSGSLVDANVVDVKFNLAVTVNVDAVKITKSPTPETCEEGGSALFISAAENYSLVEWRIVTADGNNCWRNETEIKSKFPGVQVDIYTGEDNREYLSLKTIPYSMNGFYVETKFTSKDKKSFELTQSHAALLTVERTNLEQAKINSNPANASLQPGQTTQLSVSATSPDGNTLKYQWYRNANPSTSGGTLIQGATSPSYTPLQEGGTVYYYCAVINTNGERSSVPSYSSVASVTYIEPAAEPEQPTPQAPAETPDTNAPASDTSGEQTQETESKKETESNRETERKAEKKDSSFILALGIVVAVALGCGTLIYLNLRKRG